MDKKKSNRDEIILWRFNNMIEMAQNLVLLDLIKLAKDDKYIRICGESYTAVSLAKESPLCGYKKDKKDKKDKKLDKIETILKHFNEEPPSIDEKVLEKKEEKRLQSWLIKNAIIKNRDLAKVLKLKNFDKLLFALDEVSLGDQNHPPTRRCDILAVGVKDNKVFPVLIELKSNRLKKQLEKQLDEFLKDLEKNEEKEEINNKFINLLEIVTGESINENKIAKMIIWPSSKKPKKETANELKNEGIYVIEYTNKNSDSWEFEEI